MTMTGGLLHEEAYPLHRYDAGIERGKADYLDGKPKSNPFPPDTPEHDGYGDGYDDPR